MHQAWIVANRPKLSKAAMDRIFFVKDEADNMCSQLNAVYGGVWKVYEIRVEIVGGE